MLISYISYFGVDYLSTDNLKVNRKNAIGSILAITVIFFASGILFGFFSGFIEAAFSLSGSSVQLIKRLSNIIAYVFSGIITCIVVNKSVNIKIKQRAKFKNIDYLSVILSVLMIQSIQNLTMHLISLILSNKMSIETNENSNVTLLFIIEAVIVGPIIEEINFRYALYELLLKKFNTKLIVIISSAIFALLHTYNIQGILSIFILAVILSLIYLYTHNIYNTILCHILYKNLSSQEKSDII